MSNGFVIERCMHDQPKGSCVFCLAIERDQLREENSGLNKTLVLQRDELVKLRERVRELEADIGDACEENGRIVDSSLKDIGALKAERDQLREDYDELKARFNTYNLIMADHAIAFKDMQSQLTKAKGALEAILRIKRNLDAEQIFQAKGIASEALAELGEKSYLDERLEDAVFRKLYEEQKKLVDEGENKSCTNESE